MQSQDKYRIALLSAYALALHAFEHMIPTPLPWFRLGLANIITLVTLLLYGFRAAMMVTLIRILLASLFKGTFLGPSFILSLGGGFASTAAMGFMYSISSRFFGPVGLSLIGSVAHNLTQLLLAYVLFIQRIEAIIIITPIILLMGTCTGVANGIVSGMLMKSLLKKEDKNLQNAVLE